MHNKIFTQVNQELLTKAFTNQEINSKQYNYNYETIIINKCVEPFIPFFVSVQSFSPINAENYIVYRIKVLNTLFDVIDGKYSYYLIILNDFFGSKVMLRTNYFRWEDYGNIIAPLGISEYKSYEVHHEPIRYPLNQWHIQDNNNSLGILLQFFNGKDNEDFHCAVFTKVFLTLSNYHLRISINQLWKLINQIKNNSQIQELKRLIWLLHKKTRQVSQDDIQFLCNHIGNIDYLFTPILSANDITMTYRYISTINRDYVGNLRFMVRERRLVNDYSCCIDIHNANNDVYTNFLLERIKNTMLGKMNNFYNKNCYHVPSQMFNNNIFSNDFIKCELYYNQADIDIYCPTALILTHKDFGNIVFNDKDIDNINHNTFITSILNNEDINNENFDIQPFNALMSQIKTIINSFVKKLDTQCKLNNYSYEQAFTLCNTVQLSSKSAMTLIDKAQLSRLLDID